MGDLEGMLEFLVADAMPLAIIGTFAVAWGAWTIRLLLFFYVRFRNRDKTNPYEKKETMGLPKGAIRTFFVLSFSSIAVLAFFSGERFILDEDKKWILGELGVIIAFYFGSKALEARSEFSAKMRALDLAENTEDAMKILGESPSGENPSDNSTQPDDRSNQDSDISLNKTP